MTTIQAVADRAASYSPARAALTLVSLPFLILGLVASVLWLAGTWCWAAAGEGFAMGKEQAARRRAAAPADGDSQ